ncbi:paraquat-inducible protein A [Magnetospirillum fulvum]|jgi:paraquat-inducible protein A|uniref:Paraquat-inducible protein A n=1 Tax=Magnetospirillum fulvum MGU-K5 TaxID=1316936 RepID=S9SEB7_MAGFU|nr:paraquat-inducible protein A [Magnetospirillum fulvum]EPY03069.1 paraquat-inducible protein A [Magnetospirillum fulvum MGU-K5]
MTEELSACPECDALYRKRRLNRGETARCPRCGARLYGRARLGPDQMLGLVTGALLTFIIANAYPIVVMQVQGVSNSATLSGSILTLWSEGRRLMAVLVFATTQLFPLLDLVAMTALLSVAVRTRRGGVRRPGWFAPLLRFLQSMRPWGMTEVFMLGVLVALVKLSNMAHVLPGVALWAFGALTIMLAAILSFDLRSLWDEAES